ncbi:hypothetical protein Chor_010323 [Crotalus horridus]
MYPMSSHGAGTPIEVLDNSLWDSNRHVKIKQKGAVLNMLKRLDKIRFRGHKRDEFPDLAESPNASDTECGDEIPMKIPRTSGYDDLRDTAGPGTVIMATGVPDYNRTESDRLNEIKGHLEIALLEKHFLPPVLWNNIHIAVEEELRKLREETNAETLKQELEKERLRRTELEQKVNEILKARAADESPPSTQQPPKAQNGTENYGFTTDPDQMFEDDVSSVTSGSDQIDNHKGLSSAKEKQRKYKRSHMVCSRVQKWIYDKFGEYIEDFRFQPEENTVETEEPLSARRLTENMRRLNLHECCMAWLGHSYVLIFSNFEVVPKLPHSQDLFCFIVMKPHRKPVFLFNANAFFFRGWRIQWSIVPEVSEPIEPPKEDLTVSEKFQLVLDVAQKAQNLFGKMSDILEKIKNLFMWVQPEVTQKLYIALWAVFIASCCIPYRIVGLAIGLYAGIKFFLIDFVFKRCPRLRAKYDTPYIIWLNLPTDPQLKERANATVSRRLSGHEKPQTAASRSYVGSNASTGMNRDEETSRFHGTKRGNFHEVFNLSEHERPLADSMDSSYLCFESSKSGSSKRNKVIKLADITDIQKYKVLSVLPGSGMGIAVSTPSTQKPLVFGAMVHRDEAFETIFSQYVKITSAASASES